ncbi:MAG: hypothetical protein IT269_12230 [Saprospiraceae bacterium]|nr:hypothetical protein [Saprospiraceae bacterium]
MKQLIVIVFLALFLSCGDNDQKTPPASPRAAQIANAFCQCTARLAVLNEEAKAIQKDTTAVARFEEQLRTIEQEYSRAQECAGRLRERFGQINAEDLKQIDQELSRTCTKLENRTDLLHELLGQ